MKLRAGHTYRVYDSKRWTIALDPEARGGRYSPEIHIYRRGDRGSRRVLSVRVPHLTWVRAMRWQRFGARRVYRINQKIIYRLFAR